ncbi:MAG: peptide-methionine (S)-S-oxide reductase MsrA [Brevinematales bacterium]|nr:peptide-methionine (S)-S-oxide reductase MsrA [Brevinematales bacterium]
MNKEIATLAGGCFWCLEDVFRDIEGVISVVSGYSGGDFEYPTYEDVCTGKTGHREVVQIAFDSDVVSYEEILGVFWMNIDPTDSGGQFSDRGEQYRTAIFYHNEHQKELAIKTREMIENSNIFRKPVVTEILPFKNFYPAEDYHQNFSRDNPIRYCMYKYFSGREKFIKTHWQYSNLFKKPKLKLDPRFLKKDLSKLNDEEYMVTQECRTELPFRNKYWNNKSEGIYVDVVSGEPLFASVHKFDSGTGWPSFYKPLEEGNITYHIDTSYGMIRVEIRSKHGNSHLGHVFDDGPYPTGLRYCVNSCALRFIPVEDLEKEGYGEYKKLFNPK